VSQLPKQEKYLSLDEFKEWYTQNSPEGKKKGEFTYYMDWAGFNIPSYILKPFYDGKFDPLSVREQEFLKFFEDKQEKFYVIGTTGDTELYALRHETAHGLFYTNEDYRREVLGVLDEIDKKDRDK